MTYADNNTTTEGQLLKWDSGAEQILLRLRTDTGTSSSLQVRQISGGITDLSDTASDIYPVGINVPISVASRHGETFINIAADGTASTVNTTPVSFPDLSATDIEIAPIFNGVIQEFIMWSDDIADAGIEEASA